MDLSRTIRNQMADQLIPVKAIISKTGWSQGYIWSVRSGKSNPMARLTEWAEVLGVPASELLRRAEQYPDPETQPQPKSGSEVAA